MLAHERIRGWRENPLGFVHENFKIEPDIWQKKFIELLPSRDPKYKRIALKACVGPGKSACLAWAGWWFISCLGDAREHPKGAAVSITADNLKDNLWSEFSKWQAFSPFLTNAFEWTKERIFAKDHPNTWFLSARSWSHKAVAEEQGRTLSGLHGKYVLAILDESGEIPPPVGRAAEQSLSNAWWGKILQAGNPTSQNGILYRACKDDSHLWHVITITGDPQDPDRSPRIDKHWAQEQIDTYTRENPWVMSQILGIFPPVGINSLLTDDEVELAMERQLRPDAADSYEKRIGVDVARFGDDRTVIFPRQGPATKKPIIMRNARTDEIAARAANEGNSWSGKVRFFVDVTGGLGAGPEDQLRQGQYDVYPVNYSSQPMDQRFFNKRAEMWWLMAEWVKKIGCLPKDPLLKRELTTVTYSFQNGRLILERKDQLKKRLGSSPDLGDALANTFAIPEKPKDLEKPAYRFPNKKKEYDPFSITSEPEREKYDEAIREVPREIRGF